MFPDSSGLSDDSQSGASHLWPTMVPPRYSPPHSHPDDKPPPYSPWAGGRAGWERPTAPRGAAHSRHRRTLRKRRAGEEEEEQRRRPPSERAQSARNRRASVYLSGHPSHSCLYLVWRCVSVSVCECVHKKRDQVQLITRTVYWWICCLNANRLDTPAGALPTLHFWPPHTRPTPSRVLLHVRTERPHRRHCEGPGTAATRLHVNSM